MLFRFKSTLSDFIVDEQLPYTLDSTGTHYYVHIEKQNQATMDIINHVRKKLSLPKNLIGYAGLKDKKGITRQRLSFDAVQMQRKLNSKNRTELLAQTLSTVCTVLNTWRYSAPLSLRADFLNQFQVTLRATKKLSLTEKKLAATTLESILASPFPNYFGTQRFGINGRNIKQGKGMIDGYHGDIKGFDRIFKLQAYASHLFNLMLTTRIEKQTSWFLDGEMVLVGEQLWSYIWWSRYPQADRKKTEDFFVYCQDTSQRKDTISQYTQIVLPVLWYNSILPHRETTMGKYVALFFKRQGINAKHREIFKELDLYGRLRAARVSALNPSYKREGDDLSISFGLPAWSYASVVIDLMTERLDAQMQTLDPTPAPVAPLPKKKTSYSKKPKKKGK
jgi:tRNA(Glu) U13 pseudouridine synthase TruD